ncbi:amidase domain-containing protein [Sarocladium implicatum]|nr:amidase domain-containing protein [Sarocladium implicatum]
MSSVAESNLVGYDAAELQDMLSSGHTTSIQLVEQFLAQIDRHDRTGKNLNAVISTAPRDSLLMQAQRLDTERQKGTLRSRLHGIPVLVKDAVVTGPELGMPTTVGSWALSILTPRKNAKIIDQLIEAGAIILAKTNLTEFCGLKSNDTPVGWSAYAGQTNSPYRREDLEDEDQPFAGGSSSGTAVGIASGFAPLGIGTETSGSTVYPASLNGLYAMKIGRGKVSTDGVFRLSRDFDGIGVMARTPADLAVLAEAVMMPKALAHLAGGLIARVDDANALDLRIGVVPHTWGMPEDTIKRKWGLPQVVAKYEGMVNRFIEEDASMVYPLEVADADTLKHKENGLVQVAYYEFPSLIKEFLENFENHSGIESLEDIITWNEKHADKALPAPRTGQTELYKCLKSSLTPEIRDETMTELQRLADSGGMGKVMADQGVDVVVGASDSTLIMFAACAGWPIATCPLGNLDRNGQPYGVFATAKSEEYLFRFMSCWSRTMQAADGPSLHGEDGA